MNDNQAQCSHSKVDRITIQHQDGTQSERWICPDCSTNFWPEGKDHHKMKRRHDFACAALNGMLSSTTPDDRRQLQKHVSNIPESFARIAFELADAMLAESDKKV